MTTPSNIPPSHQPPSTHQPYPPYSLPHAYPPQPAAPPPSYGLLGQPPQPAYLPQPAYSPQPAYPAYPPQAAPQSYGSMAQPGGVGQAAPQLGTYERTYTVNPTKLVIAGAVFVLIGCVLLGQGIANQTSPTGQNGIELLIFGLTALGVGIGSFLVPALRNRNQRVEMYSGGFVYADGKTQQAIRWEDIAEVYRDVNEHEIEVSVFPVYTWVRCRYTVVTRGGQRIVLKSQQGIKYLGETIQHSTFNVMMPQALAALQAGATLPFGMFAVSPQGLRYIATLAPWNEVQSVKIEQEVVKVERQGHLVTWARLNIARIPNELVFLALVERLSDVKVEIK